MLIDTSGFFSVYSEKDEYHGRAKEFYQQFRRRLTTNYVLAEYVALAFARGLAREKALTFSAEILRDETIEIVWVNEDLHAQAVALLQKRRDKNYSLCDAVSFVVMRARQINAALSTDKHFEQEGFQRLLK